MSDNLVIISATWRTTSFTSGWDNGQGGSTYRKMGSRAYPFTFQRIFATSLTTDYGARIADERFGTGADNNLTHCTYYIVHNQGEIGVDQNHYVEAIVIGIKA